MNLSFLTQAVIWFKTKYVEVEMDVHIKKQAKIGQMIYFLVAKIKNKYN